MKMHSFYIWLLIATMNGIFYGMDVHAQQTNEPEFTILDRPDKKVVIPFELINNLIIIEAKINNSEPLKFILDSGVGRTLITGLPNNEQIYVNNTRIVTIAGLGENDPLQAYLSTNNTIDLLGIQGKNLEVVILKEDIFHLSTYMGTFIHGLIGYDLFSQFVVEINYKKKVIYLYDPEHFRKKFEKLPRHRKWNKIPITLEKMKPYLNVEFKQSDEDSSRQLKLLIDSGASNAFSFYEMTEDFIHIPQKNIKTLLGTGLSGVVNGNLGRVEEVSLNKYIFPQPVVAYPDSKSVKNALRLSESNGSIGGEILRRFKVIFHYQDEYILLRSNSDMRDEFSYNISGIELITPFPNLPYYIISKVRKGSPADLAGIKKDDILEKVNGDNVEKFKLNELIKHLEGREGKLLRLQVLQDSTYKYFNLKLQNELPVD